jgi:hypothetical protein
MNAMDMGAVVGLCFTLVCVGVVAYLIYELNRRRRIKGSGWSAQGSVTRTWTTTQTNSSGAGGSHTTTNHHAEASYMTHWGEARTVRLDGHFRKGDPVTVRYDQRGGYVPLLGRKSSAGMGCGGCLAVLLVLALIVAIAAVAVPELGEAVSDTLDDVLSMLAA